MTITHSKVNAGTPASVVATDWNAVHVIGAGTIGVTELAVTTVAAGSYTNTNLTVGADGRVTAASNGAAGGGISGAGTVNALTKWATGSTVGASQITDNGAAIILPGNVTLSDITHGITVGAPLTQTLTVPPGAMAGSNGELNLMTITGAGHLTAPGDIFAYVVRNAVTFDTTGGPNASGGFYSQVTSSRSAGVAALQNKGFEANILNGDTNVAFHSLAGDIQMDGVADNAILSKTTTKGLTNLSGVCDLSASTTVKIGANIIGTMANAGTATVTAELRLGIAGAGTSGLGVHVQNTVPGIAFTGFEVGGNTTVEPSVRPSILLWRGATGIGSAVEGGIAIASGPGFPFAGIAANDLGLFIEGGGDLYLGADNTTFVPALKVKSADNSVRAMNGPMIANTFVQVGGLTGPKWSSGAGSPAAVVTGSPGDLYTNTSGGAVTTLWVKESGVASNTGWVAK